MTLLVSPDAAYQETVSELSSNMGPQRKISSLRAIRAQGTWY
jgi:hypothetical protein